MKLDYAFFAINADSTPDGRLHIFGGEIGGVSFPSFPSPMAQAALVIKLLLSPNEIQQRHTLRLTCNRRDDQHMLFNQETELRTDLNRIDPQLDSGSIVIAQICNQYPQPGIFDFSIIVDGVCLRSMPFYVSKATSAPGGAIELQTQSAKG